eukprot:tig00000402_g213.t1
MTSSPSTALVRGLLNATPPKIELITRLEDGQYSNAIRLSWTVPATGINYIYNVLGRFTPAAGGAVAFDANTTSNFFTRTGLQPGTQFQVTVRAIDLTDVDPVGPWSPPAISSTRAGGSFTLTVSSISPSIGPLEGNTTVDFTFSVGTFDISTIVPAVIVTFTFSDNTKSDVSGTWISASQFSNYPTAGMASLEVSNGDLHTDGSELYSSSGVLFGFAPKMNPLLKYFPTVKFVFGGLYSVTYKISRMGIYQTHIALNSFENPIKGSPFTTEIYAQTNSWTRMTTKNTPPARSGHSSVVLDKTKMCIFGGWTMDDIWCYDLTTDEWSELSQLPYYQEMQTVAYKRGSHSALVWNNQMYVFGGHLGYVSATQFEMTEKGTTMRDATNSTVQLRIVQNDLWVYNFTTDRKNGTWTRRWPRNADDPVNGPLPAPRHGHASAILDSGKIIIFGGRGSGFTSEMNDTWEYDIESNRWRELRCSLNDTRYPVKKVSGSRISSELYMLDLDLCVWYRMQQPAAGSSNRPKALYHHATVTYHLDTKYPKMVLFGGSFGVTNDTKELWLYEHCGGTYGVWAPLSPVPDAGAEDETGRYKPAYGPPSERHKHSLVLAELLGPKILLFGAYTYSVQANDIWAFTPDDRESYGCKDQGY